MSGAPLVALRGVRWAPDLSLPGATEVLRGVDLEIAPGERVALVGASGAGKTTLATILAGLLEPTAGDVRIAPGVADAPGAAATAADASFRGDVGLLFAEPERGFFEETVLEDVAFGPRNAGWSAEEARVEARRALALVGLDPAAFGPRAPETLSGGEARRAAIAGVLAFRPRLVVLDEPTSGLDAEGVALVGAALDAAAGRGAALLLVGHDLPFLVAHTERALVLEAGRIVRDGPADRLEEALPGDWRDAGGATGEGLAAVAAGLRTRGLVGPDVPPTAAALADALAPRGTRA